MLAIVIRSWKFTEPEDPVGELDSVMSVPSILETVVPAEMVSPLAAVTSCPTAIFAAEETVITLLATPDTVTPA